MFEKTILIDGTSVNLLVIDTSGHNLYDWLIKEIYDDKLHVILCFDMTNKESFDRIEKIIKEFSIKKGGNLLFLLLI